MNDTRKNDVLTQLICLLQVLSVFEDLPVAQTWLSETSQRLCQGEEAAQAALRQYLQCAEASADR